MSGERRERKRVEMLKKWQEGVERGRKGDVERNKKEKADVGRRKRWEGIRGMD